MTRKKKTRSLSRIHKVKTGNISKLKRASRQDRQTGKRVKHKSKSVFEKFLDENPEIKKEYSEANLKSENINKPAVSSVSQKSDDNPLPDSEAKSKRDRSLLDQLDDQLDTDTF